MNDHNVDSIFEERISNYSQLARKYAGKISRIIESMKSEMKEKIRESKKGNRSQYLTALEEWYAQKTEFFNRALDEIETVKKAGFKHGQTMYTLLRQTQDALAHSVSQLRADLK
jgi:DNA repair ATPase RecN